MFKSYTNIHLCCLATGCTDQKCKDTRHSLLKFYAIYWEKKKCNTDCHVCLFVIQYPFPAHKWCLVEVLIMLWTDAKAKTKLVLQRALTNSFRKYSQKYYYRNCSAFREPWSIWKMLTKIVLFLENASFLIVPFSNTQTVMNIHIFLHFCVWYMYYLRQML